MMRTMRGGWGGGGGGGGGSRKGSRAGPVERGGAVVWCGGADLMGSGEVRWGGEDVSERSGGEQDRGDGERSRKSLPSLGAW